LANAPGPSQKGNRSAAISASGHSRRFERASGTSAVPLTAEAHASSYHLLPEGRCRRARSTRHRSLSSNRQTSEIGYGRLRYGQGGCARKEGVRIIGADQLCQWTFRRTRQLRNALDRNLAHSSARACRPQLSGIPRNLVRSASVKLTVLTALNRCIESMGPKIGLFSAPGSPD
jgi:hypothetical protein